jgi:hypothetical protein
MKRVEGDVDVWKMFGIPNKLIKFSTEIVQEHNEKQWKAGFFCDPKGVVPHSNRHKMFFCMGIDGTHPCGVHFRNNNSKKNFLPWNHNCPIHDEKAVAEFLLQNEVKEINNDYCLKLFLTFIAVSGISLEKAASKELWDLFYAVMKLSRENLNVEVEVLWKHINRQKFPNLINEYGETNRKKLLNGLDGADVSGVIDRGKGLLFFVYIFYYL